MLLSTAFLQPSTYVTEPEGYEFGLKLAASLREKEVAFYGFKSGKFSEALAGMY